VQLLTHYHSDHTSGIPDVWLTGWLESHFGRRKSPYRVIGPTGARELMENLERAYALDVKIRVADEKLPLSGIATEIVEFDRDGIIYEKNGVKVIAFESTTATSSSPVTVTVLNTPGARRYFPATPATTKMSSSMAPAPTCWCMRLRAHGPSS
jgi:ribonuclease BN (tRNA processing enzyme)